MATETPINPDENKPAEEQSPVQSSSFDTQAFQQEAVKRKRGRPSKQDNQKLMEKAWQFDTKTKVDQPEAKPPLSPEEEARLRALYLTPENIRCVAAVYRQGLMVCIATEFKFAKLDMKLLPDKPCTQESAEGWAKNFITILIQKTGSAETTGSIMMWISLLGSPVLSIYEAHSTAKQQMLQTAVQKEIDSRVK